MEARDLAPSSGEKDEASEIRKEKVRIHEDVNGGKVIVVVTAAEAEPAACSKRLVKKEIDDVGQHDDATFSVCSSVEENLNGNDGDDDDDDDKENAAEKRILDESKLSLGNREVDKIFPLQQRTRVNRSPRPPRPANAFMLFANDWRKKIAAENPRESNKDISVRLGICWKNMPKDAKEKYFALAREVDAEHKRKYPGTSYSVLSACDLIFAPPGRSGVSEVSRFSDYARLGRSVRVGTVLRASR
ncbi:PREDICTED: FACT complex subunit SSRP1-like [Dinoponera quadriceps]|uniref:Sex-determining region Y protein n=1 Tax=Dinoponera quadriceps TaxID=609295 RepID=A0A6P3XR66_DINQU|nr:PREDICTED: FACT complex subunit SSRP1-like [Dinoponera quadriceps]